MKEVRIIIEGDPVAKGRPRFARRGKFVSTYSPQKTSANALLGKESATLQMNGRPPLEGALSCILNYFMPIPKSTSKKNCSLMISGGTHHTKKPDADNLAKQTLDFLNEVAFVDDSQIVRLVISKQYSDFPRTEIFLLEVV